ncbi:unnamed protein product, partial [Allacma fusca]
MHTAQDTQRPQQLQGKESTSKQSGRLPDGHPPPLCLQIFIIDRLKTAADFQKQ